MKYQYHHMLLLMLAVITTVVVVIVYIYMSHTVKVSVAKSSEARQAVAAAQMNKEREDTFMQTYQSTASSWAMLPKFFVPSGNVVSFIEALEALGGETGATTTLSSINADNLDSAQPGTLGHVDAHVDSLGSWSSVMRTLELAEILPYKVTISNVDVHVNGGFDKGVKQWSLNFDVDALMLVPLASSTSTTTSN